jgi:hypothetical protein
MRPFYFARRFGPSILARHLTLMHTNLGGKEMGEETSKPTKLQQKQNQCSYIQGDFERAVGHFGPSYFKNGRCQMDAVHEVDGEQLCWAHAIVALDTDETRLVLQQDHDAG